MSFLTRRKPFILVEELSNLDNTKAFLTSKIHFLIRQIRCICDFSGGNMNPEFAKKTLLWIDLQTKIAYILLYLVNSTSLEWSFLKTLKKDNIHHYLVGKLKIKGFILDTELICKKSDAFFLDLVKLGCIDSITWMNLQKLKSCSETLGIACINDSSYYDCKNIPVAFEESDLLDLEEFEKNFLTFIKNPISFQKSNPIVWNFLKITVRLNNHIDLCECIQKCSFRYENIRQIDVVKKKLNVNQYRFLVNSLAKLNSFSNLYKSAFEMHLLPKNENVLEVFGYMFHYFFLQEGDLFNPENPDYVNQSLSDRVVRSLLWIDFLIFLCRNSIFFKNPGRKDRFVLENNFSKACEIELSIFSQPAIWNRVAILEFSILTILLEKIDELKEMVFYKDKYAYLVDKYLMLSL